MRGKVVKRLRRQAREALSERYSEFEERKTEEINHHPKLYRSLVKTRPGADGLPVVIDNGVRMVHQIVNDPRTVRGLHRLLKAQYKGRLA